MLVTRPLGRCRRRVPATRIRGVPTISRFYGIVIRMYANDHPPPHFHARYGQHRARVAIETGDALVESRWKHERVRRLGRSVELALERPRAARETGKGTSVIDGKIGNRGLLNEPDFV